MKISHLDTYAFSAHAYFTPTGEARIELSKYLLEYPELHNYILFHGIRHIRTGSIYSWHNLIVDIKDRFKFFTDPKLYDQWCNFRKKNRVRRSVKDQFVFETCLIIGGLAQLASELIAIPIRMYRRSRSKVI